jgi:hypothetical protein
MNYNVVNGTNSIYTYGGISTIENSQETFNIKGIEYSYNTVGGDV